MGTFIILFFQLMDLCLLQVYPLCFGLALAGFHSRLVHRPVSCLVSFASCHTLLQLNMWKEMGQLIG